MALVEFGIDAEPFLRRKMADLSQVIGTGWQNQDDEILKAALLNKVFEGCPGLETTGSGCYRIFVKNGNSNVRSGQAQRATQTQQAVLNKALNRLP